MLAEGRARELGREELLGEAAKPSRWPGNLCRLATLKEQLFTLIAALSKVTCKTSCMALTFPESFLQPRQKRRLQRKALNRLVFLFHGLLVEWGLTVFITSDTVPRVSIIPILAF